MEKDINNGEWGYHFYYEDPHLPEQLCAWLATVCSSGLCIDDLASWLIEHHVLAQAYAISEEAARWSGADRIIDRFNQRMTDACMILGTMGLPS